MDYDLKELICRCVGLSYRDIHGITWIQTRCYSSVRITVQEITGYAVFLLCFNLYATIVIYLNLGVLFSKFCIFIYLLINYLFIIPIYSL
jgi:hypothetical protein